ncbi:DsbA family protein [Bordetella sp. 2513F-2]
MNAPRTLEMWFDFASPYSYLALARLEPLARAARVRVALRPFLLGPIFQAQGWHDTPFRLYPAKGAYMMRDVARLAAKHAIAYRRPTVFPRLSVLPARVALLGQDEPWSHAFCLAVFRANFVDDRELQDEALVRGLLQAFVPDADALLARARHDDTKAALRRQVDRARELGIFGAPMFVVHDEMFWGNDRLEDALDWAARRGGPAAGDAP